MSIGTNIKTRHFHVNAIWKEEGHIEVAPHVHEHGRYNDGGSFLGHSLPFSQQVEKEKEKLNKNKENTADVIIKQIEADMNEDEEFVDDEPVLIVPGEEVTKEETEENE